MGDSIWPIVLVGDIDHPIGIVPNHPSTDKVWKIAFGMASNLFQLNHNFLTHFIQTHGNLWLICNDCLRPSGHFADLACSCAVVYLKKDEITHSRASVHKISHFWTDTLDFCQYWTNNRQSINCHFFGLTQFPLQMKEAGSKVILIRFSYVRYYLSDF